MDHSPFPPPAIVVNIVLIGRLDGQLGVVLTKCADGSLREKLALPGTYLRPDETIEDAARRELGERTGIYTHEFHLVGVFSDPRRDPSERTVSIALVGAAYYDGRKLAQEAPPSAGAWYPLTSATDFALDHREITNAGVYTLQKLAWEKPVAADLLKVPFTLADFQAAQEALLDQEFDKRNFRRDVLSRDWLEPVGTERRGAHRPALLFTTNEPDAF